MALFRFKCPKCDYKVKRLFKTESGIPELKCPTDQENLIRDEQVVGTVVYESIDTGLQIKKVTQIANSPELIEERQDIQRRNRDKKTL